MIEPAIIVEGLRVRYPDGLEVAVGGLAVTIRPGERAALLGPNGSGKSTILRTVLGLIRPIGGEVKVFGRDPVREFDSIRPRIGAVLQDVEAQLLGPSVAADLALGLVGRGLAPEEEQRRVQQIAGWFDLVPLLERVPHYLSGGERRKVALAGALITEPELLVLDEPFAGLDPRSRKEITRLVCEAHAKRGITVLLSTHEVQELPDLVDTIFVLSDEGDVVARGDPADVFAMADLLARCNLEPPPLARLRAALGERGFELPASNDPRTLADVLLRQLGGESGKERGPLPQPLGEGLGWAPTPDP